jgi:peptidoglycan/LPS O-acetylase OafA/YrhL
MTARSEASPIRLPEHLPSLDGVRGAAILLVLFHEFDLLEHVAFSSFGRLVVNHAVAVGWVGVQLFFVLSGFLITGILLDTRERPGYFRSFYIRRVLRIFPLYYGALLLFLVVLPGLGMAPAEWRENQLWYWAYLSNWNLAEGKAMPHFWSLAVEEQFYLLWPFVVLRFSARPLLNLCIAVAIASLAIRTTMVLGGISPDAIYEFSTSRMDALALGGAAAAVLRLPDGPPAFLRFPRRLWAFAWVLAIIGLVTTHFYQRTTPLGQTLGYSVLAIVFATVIYAQALVDADAGPALRWPLFLRSRFLRALGTYSYGMYVVHRPLQDLIGKPALQALGFGEELGLGVGLAYILAATLVTFLAGMLTYWCYERHFLALKRRRATPPRDP